MHIAAIEKIANAVLYEGYLLYPYRASAVKNRQRFNFGVLYPPEYCENQAGSDASEMRIECLASGDAPATIEVASIRVKARFLQMAARQDRQEGLEREICIGPYAMESIAHAPVRREFLFEGADIETLRCELEIDASRLNDRLFRVSLNIRNRSTSGPARDANRDDVLLRSLVSVHSIIHAEGAGFISLLDPPEQHKNAAAACRNIGAWPVLAGEEGQRDTMLAAPIILYDYPRIAPESPGDLFDGTEIDEILALRILTMTDDEKLEVRNGDDRARRILERTEMLPPEHFQKLHGALRGLQERPR